MLGHNRENARRRMPRRHAQGLRRHPRVSRAGGAAPHLRRDGAPHRDQARFTCHGEKSAAYMADGYARASGKPGICMAQVIGALNLAAGLRDAWLAHSPVIAFTGGREPQHQVPQGLSGDRRHAGVRAGDQVQRHGRRRGALSRHGAAGVPRRGLRHARAGASAVPRQRGPDRRRGGGDGAAGRAAVRARAAVPARAGPGERAGGARSMLQERRAAGDRRRRRRARLGRAAPSWSRSPRRCRSRSRPRSTARTRIPGQPSALGRRRRHLFARERQPRRQPRRPRLLRRHRDRRHDHAFLGGAEDRHAGDPDRHRSGGARPQLSAARRRSTATPR